MLELSRLLKFSPDDAVLMMANQVLGTYLRPEIARVGAVLALEGRRTLVPIEVLDVTPEMIQNPYDGTFQLEYNRYDLTEVFGRILIEASLPTTVDNLIRTLSQKTGIVFDKDDFSNEVVDTASYTLIANPGSKRWVGDVEIQIDEDGGVDISQWLPNRHHGGLVQVVKEYLHDAFPNEILNGFVLPLPDISIYLRSRHHGGLVLDEVVEFKELFPEHRHGGLMGPYDEDLTTTFPVNHHDGLLSPQLIEQYLQVRQHKGLFNKPEIGDLMPVNHHQGLTIVVDVDDGLGFQRLYEG